MKTTTIVMLCVLMAACATSSKLNQISPGMSKQEVVSIMGNPKSTSADGRVEYLRYSLATHGLVTEEHFVRIVDGKVDAYGRVGDFGTSDPTVNVNLNR